MEVRVLTGDADSQRYCIGFQYLLALLVGLGPVVLLIG